MVFVYFIFLIFAMIVSETIQSPPTIIPDSPPTITPERSEHILSRGDNYTLTCKGDKRLRWTVPLTKDGDETLQPEAVRDYEDAEDGSYIVHLHLYKVNDLAVGYYFCNTSDTSSSTYVFVEDDNKLHVGRDPLTFVEVKLNSVMVIPCRPTSPKVTVRLYQGLCMDPKSELQLSTTSGSGEWIYKNREGIYTPPVTEAGPFYTLCTFTKGTKTEEARYSLHATK